jgi:hypothetical protein
VSRTQQDRSFPFLSSPQMELKTSGSGARIPGMRQDASKITALNIEFVAKPNEAHKVQTALPEAINGALRGVAGYAGSLVMISNYEARLVTVVTLWSGGQQMQRCDENVRWVRALVTPYLDRCLRVQSLAAYVPENTQPSRHFEESGAEEALKILRNEEAAVICAA